MVKGGSVRCLREHDWEEMRLFDAVLICGAVAAICGGGRGDVSTVLYVRSTYPR